MDGGPFCYPGGNVFVSTCYLLACEQTPVIDARRGPLTCQVWTERLREWLAAQVLQPLVAAVNTAHKVRLGGGE